MKNDRREFILNLIGNNEIEKQEELVALLVENGYKATQATVSRDINLLGLKKSLNHNKKMVYIASNNIEKTDKDKLETIFHDYVTSIRFSNNIIVIKTIVGSANSACAMIDKMNIDEILGTVAGDDTIIIVAENAEYAEKLATKFERMIR